MRLIDADALIEELTPSEDVPNNGAKLLLAVFVDAVKAFPTIDAVPVVRCRDCTHFNPFRPHDGFCAIDGMIWENNSYCSWGKRREDGDT